MAIDRQPFSATDDLDLEPGQRDTDAVPVRLLTRQDLDAVLRIDAAATGYSRKDFYRARLERSQAESSVHLSLAAELDNQVVGFVTVTFYQGEYGHPERSASLDAIGVHPDYAGRHVAAALMTQLEMNLRALHVETIRTEVDWNALELIGFFHKAGLAPVPRLCLERKITR